MKLFNTLTKSIEEIQPLIPPHVGVYTCGPTVYDYAHIGHWFTYVRMDTLIRALKLSGLETTWVMNITDVGHLVSDADSGEDKLEKGAKREGKTAWEVAEFYTQDFLACMQLLTMKTPYHIVKATDHINEQIALIQKLETKGYTYKIDDGVYYDTSKFPGYANFARLDLDDLQAGARVSFNPQKKSASDFALWKFSPSDHKRDMEWESPWGKGFPGWHIECSAMSMKYLGDTLDIHTGGIDHIPTHHTNEIAQSEAATGKRFANYWMHSNHVLIDGEKISKSLGNGIRLQDIIDKGISPEAVRLHILESHYRSQSKFSWDSLIAASNRLTGLRAMAALKWQLSEDKTVSKSKELDTATEAFKDCVFLDLDTPAALAVLASISNDLGSTPLPISDRESLQQLLTTIDGLLGLHLHDVPDITVDQKQLIHDREAARSEKNWQRSDELRDELARQYIGINDLSDRTIWHPLSSLSQT